MATPGVSAIPGRVSRWLFQCIIMARSLDPAGSHAAVDWQQGAGDPRRLLRGEKQHRLGHVCRLAIAPQWVELAKIKAFRDWLISEAGG